MITNVLICLSLYLLVFAVSEFFYRKIKVSYLLSRKIAHIGGAVVSCLLPYFVPVITAAIIGIVFFFAIFASKKSHLLKGIHDKNGNGVGEVIFPLGLSISAMFIWPASVAAFQGSCLVLGLSDGLAGYFGTKYGKKKYALTGKYAKSLEGTIIFYLVTLAIFSLYYFLFSLKITLPGAMLVSLYALGVTAIEALSADGWDNLSVPIAAGLALYLIIK